ncbi:MAG: Lrp/AsnC family transcriptional regulator [Candidatus Freyarchaeota archaeon]
MRGSSSELTDRQIQILKKLYDDGETVTVRTAYKSQEELAKELKITRQALSAHLKKLREEGYIRTGRGFIDLTEKGLDTIGALEIFAFVLIKVHPHEREKAYREIRSAGATKLFRVTGEIDLIAEVSKSKLDEFLRRISQIPGVTQTEAHVVLESMF